MSSIEALAAILKLFNLQFPNLSAAERIEVLEAAADRYKKELKDANSQ